MNIIEPVKGKIRPVERSITIGTVSTPLVAQSSARWGLVLPCPPTNRITMSLLAAAVLDQGIQFYPAGQTLWLSYNDFGAGLQLPIQAISAVAPQIYNFWELFLEELTYAGQAESVGTVSNPAPWARTS